MPYAKACSVHRNTPELAAGLVICDAVWLGGRGESGSILVCPHPSFIPLHIFPRGHEWFSYHNIWGRLHSLTRCYTRCFGAGFPGMKEWCNAIFKDRLFFFLCVCVIYCNWLERKRQMWSDRQANLEKKKNRESQLQLCMRERRQAGGPLVRSVHHSRCVSVLSFIMAVGELAVLLPSVTKLLIIMSILITPASSTFTAFIHRLHWMYHIFKTITYWNNTEPINICRILAQDKINVIWKTEQTLVHGVQKNETKS